MLTGERTERAKRKRTTKQNTMKKPQPLAVGILPLAEIQKLTVAEMVKQCAANVFAASRAYMNTAKFMLAIEDKLKAPQTLGGVLAKAGIKKSTIDNARYALRAWKELVEPGLISEEQFDALSHPVCFNLARVQNPKSKRQLSIKEAAEVLIAADDPQAELESVFHTGLTIAEADAEAARLEQEAKDAEEKRKAEAEEAAKKTAQAAATTESPEPEPEPNAPTQTVTTGIEPGAGEEAETETDPAPSEAEAQPGDAREPEADPAPAPTATKETPAPAAAPQAKNEPQAPVTPIPTLTKANEMMDQLEQFIGSLTEADQGVFLNNRLIPFVQLMSAVLAESEAANTAATEQAAA